ncbi:Collagen adhesin [Frankliniella fusca]|uniref:Collagen adhesin n=1 Tax=Frankliniella fusca TaxID=407009 RepID=A0AAE1I145_9NEOP|nr:Collagen adhesin [Frankliniella fusca]
MNTCSLLEGPIHHVAHLRSDQPKNGSQPYESPIRDCAIPEPKINTRNLVWVFLLCFWRILRIEEVIRSDCFERILGHDTNLEDIALMVLYFPH